MIIDKYLYGWGKLEPIILAAIAKNLNILLIGSHGCGKTSLGKFIADALGGKKSFMRYSMDKENLLSMIGCPNPHDLKEGKLNYATHERSIFHADIVLLDEITRAGKENQNMVLEILENQTVFGKPLKYEFAIATANEETYKGSYKLDAALLDRFYAVIPVPTTENTDGLGPEEIKEMILLNQCLRTDDISLENIIDEIRNGYNEIYGNKKLIDNINEFCSRFLSLVVSNVKELNKSIKEKIRLSFRQIAVQFPKLLISVAAYYKTQTNSPNYLQDAAHNVIYYSLVTKLNIPIEKLHPLFEQLKMFLSDDDQKMVRIKSDLVSSDTLVRLKKFNEEIDLICKEIEVPEIIAIIGDTIDRIKTTEEAQNLYSLYRKLINKPLDYSIIGKIKLTLLRFTHLPWFIEN